MFRLSKPGMLIREEPIKDSESLPLCKWTRENSTTPCCSILIIIMAATPKGMDVVGLDNGAHGQSCAQHSVCSHFVLVAASDLSLARTTLDTQQSNDWNETLVDPRRAVFGQ
jgi:hypothetical protein